MAQRGPTMRLLAALIVVLVAVGGLFATALAYVAPVSNGNQLPLSTVQALAAAGHLQSAVLHDADHRVTGSYVPSAKGPATPFWTSFPASDAEVPVLLERLATGGATVSVDRQGVKSAVQFLAAFVGPPLILALLLAIGVLLVRSGTLARIRRPGTQRPPSAGHSSPAVPVTLRDVAGAPEPVARLRDALGGLHRPPAAGLTRPLPLRGLLLHGPSGCGKTLLARAAAGEAGLPLVSVDDWRAGGGGGGRPALVMAERVDTLTSQEARDLAARMLDLADDSRTVVLATATDVDAVDPALLRPGCLDLRVALEPPDAGARRAILELHMRGFPTDRRLDLDTVVSRTCGLTGADLAAVVSEAAGFMRRASRQTIQAADVDDALIRVTGGPTLRGSVLTADERRRAAVHEAGHAIAAAALGRGRHVQRLSVLRHGAWLQRDAGGGAESRSDLLARLTVLCAGVAAEEVYFDEPSTAAAGDLAAATALARDIAGRYGMSSQLGRAQLTGTPTGPAADDLQKEVRRLLDDATAAATERLQRCHEPFVDLVLQLERDETAGSVQLGDLMIRALEVEIEGMAGGGTAATGASTTIAG